MDEPRYSNRQIERMLDQQSADLKDHIDKWSAPILKQTTLTNGRVSSLEKNQKKLVLALVAVSGVVLGMVGANPDLLRFVLSLLA